MDPLLDTSAKKIAAAIRARDVSSTEVTEAFLERIASINPDINAAVQVMTERAIAEAQQADEQLVRGIDFGPLHGVPFTAKDIFDTEGVLTAAGLPERSGHTPDQDAVAVARLRAAGAILIAKTNCPPAGGGGVTDNEVYGRTNNPYDLDRTPGGSSGGEAALQGAGGSPIGLGSDSGGSIRLPAHYCGVAGLKPTSGRVPNTGAYELPGGLTDTRTQVGPLSRFVEDLELALSIIAGPDWHDSGVIPMPLGVMDDVSIGELRAAYYEDDGCVTPTPETKDAVKSAALSLKDAGASVVESLPPGLEEAGPITQGYWGMTKISGAEVEQLYLRWDRFRSRMLAFMRDHDVIICPVDHHPAPHHDDPDEHRFAYTLAYSLTGWPCVVVRAGTSMEGMPIGVQIVARPWREDVALAVARHIETAMGGWQPPGA
ncbi:amidase [soil metagenome]